MIVFEKLDVVNSCFFGVDNYFVEFVIKGSDDCFVVFFLFWFVKFINLFVNIRVDVFEVIDNVVCFCFFFILLFVYVCIFEFF